MCQIFISPCFPEASFTTSICPMSPEPELDGNIAGGTPFPSTNKRVSPYFLSSQQNQNSRKKKPANHCNHFLLYAKLNLGVFNRGSYRGVLITYLQAVQMPKINTNYVYSPLCFAGSLFKCSCDLVIQSDCLFDFYEITSHLPIQNYLSPALNISSRITPNYQVNKLNLN